MQLKLAFGEAITERIHERVKSAPRPVSVSFKKPKPDNSAIVDKLLKHAQSLLNQAEKVNTEVSGNWTHRRQRFADSARGKKDRLIKNATAIERLADLWKENECPDILKHVRSANDFDVYFPVPPDKDHGDWYHEAYPKLSKKATRLGITSKEKASLFNTAVKELSEITLSPEEIKKRELDKAIVELRGKNIPGFYPTPDKVIEVMLEHADVQSNDLILEPSAGIGSIVNMLVANGHPKEFIWLVEHNYALQDILRLKGYNVTSTDIFTYQCVQKYDKILMNPPFEKMQDIKHVMHCYNRFLASDGKLVSVMSAGTTSRNDNLTTEFMKLVNMCGYVVDLGQQFNNADAFRNTGVSTILVILNK